MPELWAGIDAGKAHHHCVLIDDEGNRLLSRRVANDEAELTELITDVRTLAAGKEILWATDLNRGGAALLIGVLEAHHQTLVYIPGRSVYHAARTYRGDGKSDAKDAAIIADQARYVGTSTQFTAAIKSAPIFACSFHDARTSFATAPARSTGSAPLFSNISPPWKQPSTTPWSRPQ